MQLDLPTLFVTLVVLAGTLSLVVGVLAWRNREDGLPQFTAGLMLHAVTYGAVGLRGLLDDATLISVANITATSGFAMFNEALFRFRRRPTPRLIVWSPPLAALAMQVWVHGRTTERVIVLSILVAVQCATALALLARHRRETVGLGQYMLAANFLVILATLSYRAIVVATRAPGQQARLVEVQGISFLMAMTTLVVMALAFVIMAKEAADERNRELAMRDELTGLGNRRTLLEALEQQSAQSQRSRLPLTVLVIDLDRFKAINDAFGHLSGDIALRGAATLMQSTLRRQDVIGRMGGEEFLVILPATPRAGAMIIAERLRRIVEAATFTALDGTRMPITISVGLHEFDPRAELRIDDVIGAADQALYRAKAEGRNRVVAA